MAAGSNKLYGRPIEESRTYEFKNGDSKIRC